MQLRAELGKPLAGDARFASATPVVVMMVALDLRVLGLRCLSLEGLLNIREVLLLEMPDTDMMNPRDEFIRPATLSELSGRTLNGLAVSYRNWHASCQVFRRPTNHRSQTLDNH